MGPQLALQLLDGQGAVLRQAVESAALRAEQGVVHLAAAGVHHGAENGVLVGDAAVGNGLQCGNPHAGDIFRQGNSLYTGDADAHPRKGARPMGNGDGVQLPAGAAHRLQQALHHGEQRLAVDLLGVAVEFPQQLAVLHQSGRGGHRGGINPQCQHAFPLLSNLLW